MRISWPSEQYRPVCGVGVDTELKHVAGAVAHLPLAREVCDGPDGANVIALEEAQDIQIGKPLVGDDLVVEVEQRAELNGKTHSRRE